MKRTLIVFAVVLAAVGVTIFFGLRSWNNGLTSLTQ